MAACDTAAPRPRRALIALLLACVALAGGLRPASAAPDDGRAEHARLVEAAKASRWEDVRALAVALLAAHPDSRWVVDAAGLASDAGWHLRRYDEALAYAERYLRIAPSGGRAERLAVRRGEALFRLARGPEAKAALEAALATHPTAEGEAMVRKLLGRIDPKDVDVRGDVVFDYAGKYVGDPRLAARIEEVVKALPVARRRVRERLGLPAGDGPPVRVRFRDTGERQDGAYMQTAMELVGSTLRSAVVIRTEKLVVGYDVAGVLTHELTHVQQNAGLGERTDGTTTWAREGAAQWVCEGGERRLRIDLWGVARGSDAGPTGPLLDGLRTKHRTCDYSEDWLAFAWIERTKGEEAARTLARRITQTADAEGAFAQAAGMPFPEAEARARAYAEQRVRAGLAGADVYLAALKLQKERKYADAVAAYDALLAATPEHLFAPRARLDRAVALAHLRRWKEAFAEFDAIERSPWSDILADDVIEERVKIAAGRKDLPALEAAGTRFLRDGSILAPARLAGVRALWTKAGGAPPPPDVTPGPASDDDDADEGAGVGDDGPPDPTDRR